MSDPSQEPFSRVFTRLDPQARLDEFHKRFDRLRSEFDKTPRPMFESALNRQQFANQPSWTGPTNENMHQANGHVPAEKTIPIHVQHERSRSEPMDGSNQATNSPNMNERRHFMPDNANFFQHKFAQHPFANADGTSDAEPRVHHIPIQVESRNATSPPTKPVPPPPHHPQQHQSASSQASAPNQASFGHPLQTAATTSSFTDPKPNRVIDVPIQITKSSSTPETSKKCESNLQQSSSNAHTATAAQAATVSEATSDPVIADPSKVYPMGYEPLQNDNNQQAKPNGGEAKKETPFDYVKEILDDLQNYESQVHEFNGTTPEDKGYRWLDEMLTLCILRLDCINIDGNDELRKYRKSAINEVNRVAAILEAKVSKPKASEAQSEPTQNTTADTPVVQNNAESTETEDSKDNKKDTKKGKAKKDKEKAKKDKDSGEKKEGRRIILFRGKSKNKANAAAAPDPNDPNSMDVDPNNNDLKDEQANQSTSDQNSETASTSSSSTLQGKETAV